MVTRGSGLVLALALVLGACGFGDNSVQQGTGTCGDGIVDPAEGCDDGNIVGNDGCSASCEVETANPVCGNGVREVGEPCDDGNTAAGDGCSPTCEVESVCGNGTRETGEECDDGNTAGGDGCSAACTVEAAGACTVVPQGGCPAGDACDFGDPATGPFACRDVTANGTADSLCAVDTACAPGFTCVDGGSNTPWCMRFCDNDNQCGFGARCVDELTSNGTPLAERVCSNACDILGQTGCPTGLGCLGFEDGAKDFTDCAPMGTKLDGQTCAVATDCRPGSLCVNVGGQLRCHSFCDQSDPTTCAAGETCSAFSVALEINGTGFGFCE